MWYARSDASAQRMCENAAVVYSIPVQEYGFFQFIALVTGKCAALNSANQQVMSVKLSSVINQFQYVIHLYK